jgi:putative oxidoreductase
LNFAAANNSLEPIMKTTLAAVSKTSEKGTPMTATRVASHIGRAGLALFFILAGINKILAPDVTMALIVKGGLSPVWPVYIATIAFELVAGAALLAGGRWAAVSGVALAVFCVLTNLVFHRFWGMTGDVAMLELSLFFKNLAIAFGLLYVAAQEWGI